MTGQDVRRRYQRVNLGISGYLYTDPGNQKIAVVVEDVSLKGALVQVTHAKDVPAQEGGMYMLKFHLDAQTEVDMHVECRHIADQKMGLLCKDIDVKSVTFLRKIIELNTGDINLLEREFSELLHVNKS